MTNLYIYIDYLVMFLLKDLSNDLKKHNEHLAQDKRLGKFKQQNDLVQFHGGIQQLLKNSPPFGLSSVSSVKIAIQDTFILIFV